MKFVVYQDISGKWRWRAKRSGRIVADSGQGYSRKFDAKKSAKHFCVAASRGADIVVIDH
jgi:uncharacterized protein YegP (UPF0339 family)